MTDRDEQNTQGVADVDSDADTASGGAPDEPDTSKDDDATEDRS